jgi:hypothetical protein
MIPTLFVACCSTATATVWKHGWSSAAEFVFSHGKNKSGLLTAIEADYLAKHYAIHCGGNCDGAGAFKPLNHEKAATQSAIMMRKSNPNIKNLFYFSAHSERELGVCSSADPVWEQHPEWKVHNSTGGIPTKSKGRAWIDCRVPAYRKFVIDHLFDLLSIVDNTSATPKPLFDAVYSDGYGGGQMIPGVTKKDNEAIHNASGGTVVGVVVVKKKVFQACS